ncbi:unnamed protein product [Medioppia subpectinata]|uniref:Deoxynucleoside kinase domain-containing protein n=1 Tax=Medioppia subpectinata TaxID=1979941 RepID=A0A7R9PU75_9ACAR|nr:unnamed protein product [Medioppia subpectinata]CAG2100902.1 unnamed protein product [Medioppia subpectinata]
MSFTRLLCSTKLINGLNCGLNGRSVLMRAEPLVKTSRATLIGVDQMDPEVMANKPKPWPYKTKRHYMYWHYILDLDVTAARMDCNSKIVVIEGNKASGKEVVAKELAKHFGMHYMPEPDLEDMYINHNGFDYRSLNKYLSPIVQAVDEKMYYEDPHHKGVHWMKMFFYRKRFEQYIEALAHFYNTGQGVILERSPYSDFVFTEAMNKCGYFTDNATDYYYRVRHRTIFKLQRPHLVIYLDVSPEECLRRIKERNIPHEVNSKVLTKEYLQIIGDQYKKRFLPEIAKHSEVMIYDWNQLGDMEDMIDDIEKVNLEDWDPHFEKFEDWNLWEEDLWEIQRHRFTNKKDELVANISTVPVYDVDDLCIDQESAEHRDKIYEAMVPNYEILPSYDPANTSLMTRLFRWKLPYREWSEFNLRHPFY